MSGGRYYDVLGPVDTAFLHVDRPETPMNIGALTIFEGQIDFDEFVALVDSRIHQAPLYQKRVLETPLNLGQPMWAFDPDFAVQNHIFHAELEAPGSEEQLRELAGALIGGMLDREKPLWEIYVISGLAEERTAVLFKIHHAMVDGLAAVEIFSLLLDLLPDPVPAPHRPIYDPPPLPDLPEQFVDALREDLPHKLNMLHKLGRDLTRMGSILLDKEKRRKTLVGVANLLNDNLTPIKQLAINGRNTGRMSVVWAGFSLAEVRAIKSVTHSSVNDVMLCVLAAAVDRYLDDRTPRARQAFIRMLVPVNMRIEQEKAAAGNRISVLPIDVPFHLSPLERLQAVTEYTTIMKESSLSVGLDIVLTLPALTPAFMQPLVWSMAPVAFSLLAHTWCTNVVGPQIPLYMLGHRMLHAYGYFPLNPSMGLACVVMSYNQAITMNLIADVGIVPDVATLGQYLEEEFVALRKAAGVQPMEPVEIPPRRPEPRPVAEDTVEDEVDASIAAEIPAHPEGPPGEPPVPRTAASLYANGAAEPVPAPVMVGEAVAEAEPAPEPEAVSEETSEPVAEAAPEELPEVVVETVPEELPEAVAEATPAQDETPAPRLFTEEWAQAYHEAINSSESYRRASTRWTAGPLALVMKASPRNGYLRDSAVLLDLHRGVCREASSLPPASAAHQAAFVIEGDHKVWMRVLSGQAPPLLMIIRGKLRLTKGSIRQLLPFTQSAQELINCAQTIS